MTTKQFKYLSDFKCLADKCPDNCCYGWDINVDNATHELYETKAPEMLEFIDQTESSYHMKKKCDGSGDCIKLKNGLCHTEAQYGSEFLSNTCFMFPRVRHQVGKTLLISAELSCPEITRICLYGDEPFTLDEGIISRTLPEIKNSIAEGDSEEDVFNTNQSFINFCANETITAEQIILAMAETVTKLEALPKDAWSKAASLFLPLSINNDIAARYDDGDPFKLLQIIVTMLSAAKKTNRKRLLQALATIESVFQIKIDIGEAKIELSSQSVQIYEALLVQWRAETNNETRKILKRYIQAELALSLFPYNQSEFSLYEQLITLAFKFAFIRLTLISNIHEAGLPLTPEIIITAVQGNLRYLNHTGDIKTLLSLCKDYGWYEKPRLKGMLYSRIFV